MCWAIDKDVGAPPASAAGARLQSLEGAFEDAPKVVFQARVRGIEQFTARNHHHIEPRPHVAVAEDLLYQTFGAIAANRIPELPGGDDPEARAPEPVGSDDDSHEPPVDPLPCLEHPLELRAPSKPSIGPEFLRSRGGSRLGAAHDAASAGGRIELANGSYDEETVSRLRPFARRRLSTSRPFLVLMRTRNPWVRRRRRRFG